MLNLETAQSPQKLRRVAIDPLSRGSRVTAK